MADGEEKAPASQEAPSSFVPDGARDGLMKAHESAGAKEAAPVAEARRTTMAADASERAASAAAGAGKAKRTVDALAAETTRRAAGSAAKKLAATTAGAGAAWAARKTSSKIGSPAAAKAAGAVKGATIAADAKRRLGEMIDDDGSELGEQSLGHALDNTRKAASWSRKVWKKRKAKAAAREAEKVGGAAGAAVETASAAEAGTTAARTATRAGTAARAGLPTLTQAQGRRNLATAIAESASRAAASAGHAVRTAIAAIASAITSAGAALGGVGAALGAAVGAVVVASLVISAITAILPGSSERNVSGMNDAERQVAAYLLDKGLDDVHVAAIMGNIRQECSFDPGSITSVAMGLCQWAINGEDGGRGDRLMQWAGAEGRDWSDVDTQMDWLWAEMTEEGPAAPYASRQFDWDGFLETSTVEGATEYFCDNFERPGEPQMENRVWYAQEYYDDLCSNNGGDADAVCEKAMELCDDNTIGYQWGGNGPDYDCSSFVRIVLVESGTIPSECPRFSTFDEAETLAAYGYEAMDNPGFESLEPGDILLNAQEHTAIYIGDGQVAEAADDYDGMQGDSGGDEVYYHTTAGSYVDSHFETVLRKAS